MDLLPTHHPACRPLVVTTGRARRNATRPCRDPPCSPAPARRVRGGAIWRAVHSLAYHPRVGRCRGTEFMATPPRFSSQPLAPCAEAGRYECDPEHVCGVRTVDVNNETAQQGITRDRESAVARRILSPGIGAPRCECRISADRSPLFAWIYSHGPREFWSLFKTTLTFSDFRHLSRAEG